jgi:V/A-type H+-transporting ATPase subunit D
VLERHRDGLVFDFLDLFDRWSALRTRLDEQFHEARALYVSGVIREGEITLRELSNSRSARPELVVDETKLLGVYVPRILSTNISKPVSERGYGILGTSALDDDIVSSYEQVLESVVRVAEIQATLSRLVAEIRRLRVRVNYLNHRLIPDLESEKQYIQRHLDEREQEERSRQFWVKGRRRARRGRRQTKRPTIPSADATHQQMPSPVSPPPITNR